MSVKQQFAAKLFKGLWVISNLITNIAVWMSGPKPGSILVQIKNKTLLKVHELEANGLVLLVSDIIDIIYAYVYSLYGNWCKATDSRPTIPSVIRHCKSRKWTVLSEAPLPVYQYKVHSRDSSRYIIILYSIALRKKNTIPKCCYVSPICRLIRNITVKIPIFTYEWPMCNVCKHEIITGWRSKDVLSQMVNKVDHWFPFGQFSVGFSEIMLVGMDIKFSTWLVT